MKQFGLLSNPVLITGFISWSLAQLIKIPWNYFSTRNWDWVLLLRAGGMPSSHAALVASVAHSIGLFAGFDTLIFALAFTLAVIVIYDATGIRRQAGIHAEIINRIVRGMVKGERPQEKQLREVLGHTPMEALAGTLLGVGVAQLIWFLW